jgi:hypothetical protein
MHGGGRLEQHEEKPKEDGSRDNQLKSCWSELGREEMEEEV